MIIDIIVLVTLIIFGIWGARRGLLKQVAAVVAIILMYLFASPIADIALNIIKDNTELTIPPRYLHVLLISISATAIFVIITLIGEFLHKTLVKGVKPLEKANKAFGFTLGLISSGCVIYFILCLANCGMGWIDQYAPSLAKQINSSYAYTVTNGFNIVEARMPELAKKAEKMNDSGNKTEDNDTNAPTDTVDNSMIRVPSNRMPVEDTNPNLPGRLPTNRIPIEGTTVDQSDRVPSNRMPVEDRTANQPGRLPANRMPVGR